AVGDHAGNQNFFALQKAHLESFLVETGGHYTQACATLSWGLSYSLPSGLGRCSEKGLYRGNKR
ncbi:hypothetical protein, partial [Aquitalea sp.]|uniref:hypothetical protein n=1 Tax=Aquitalea sp. TaxID=1872623 RepID=UPI00258B3B34